MVSVTVKNVRNVFCVAAGLFALTFCACEKVPENCGDGQSLNNETQFCFGGQTYDKCRGATYDPTANKCESGVLKDKCGGSNWYDPATEFCLGGTAYALCGGLTYDPANQTCQNNALKTKCGDNYYTPATEFCSGGTTYAKCGGLTYDPTNQTCVNNVVMGTCGDAPYNPATQICGDDGNVTAITYTFTVNASPAVGGMVSSVAETGTSFRITAVANDGYEFVNWTTAANGGATLDNANSAVTTVKLSSNAAVTANFRQTVAPPPPGTTYTLQVSRSPTAGGATTPAASQSNIAGGTPVSITATAASGYAFANWTVTSGAATIASPTSAATTVTLSSSATIQANFQQSVAASQCTLRVSRNVAERGNVAVTVSGFTTNNPTAALVYPAGTSVTITATAAGGEYPFTNWTAVSGALPQGVAATNATVTFSISGDVNIQARFGPPTPVITTFTDTRDGKIYKQVTIGNQTWMAENLNVDIPGVTTDVCYNNADSNCVKYGRLYNWETAMAGASSSSANPSGVQGICPSGWHIPSDAEWTQLTDFVGGADSAGMKLKATTGWRSGNGYDDYGFSALPGGIGFSGGSFSDARDNGGSWWSATEDNASYAWGRYMGYDYENVFRGSYGKALLNSVRCVAD